jgi:RNA-directed DNA polymerase
MELHPDKTKIVYCKDKNRKENNEEIQFELLGYASRPRRCINKKSEVTPIFFLQ